MFCIRLADKVVELDNRYGSVEALCQDYRCTGESPIFRVRVTEAEITAYMATCRRPMAAPEAESHLLYRRICERMPLYDTYLLHAAVVEMDGRGYAFSARRGGGKTTHAGLWRSHFAGRAMLINGDKPLIRSAPDGRLWVYGTPWGGKEGFQVNRKCPLSALCFLEKAPRNTIIPASSADTVARLLEATLLPPDPRAQDRMAALIGKTVRTTPAYVLACRPDVTAVETAYECLSQL